MSAGTRRCPVCAGSLEADARCPDCGHALGAPSTPPTLGVGPEADDALLVGERRRAVTRLQRDLLPLGATDGNLLEAGSSTGAFCAAARSAGYATRGLEVSDYRRRLAARHNDVDLEAGGLLDADVAAASTGVVVLSRVLAESADPLAVLRVARRALVRGGFLLVAVPVSESAYCGASDFGGPLPHRFSPASLGRALHATEFHLLDCYSPDGEDLVAVGSPA